MNASEKIGRQDLPAAVVVALTGRSGSGKSTVAKHFSALGYPVLDGDKVAREVTLPGSPCLAQLAKAFGRDVLAADGTLRRQLLAARAFDTPEGVQKLTDITHPEIVARLLRSVREAQAGGARVVFVDGAVIIGGRFEQYCDKIVVITAPEKDCVSRIVLRDGISKEAARERLAAQLPEQALCAAADYVLANSGTQEALLRKADAVLEKLQPEGEA